MSRFVSAGSIDAATGEATESVKLAGHAAAPSRRNEEWKAAQEKLEADRRRREEQQRRQVGQDAEKSLYEVLQANKAAKQAAFEEANRLKNQFRALHDDEIDFLDGVRASARAEEERLRRETEEGLKAFRAARDAAPPRASSADGGGGPPDTTTDGEGEPGHHGEEATDWAAAGRSRRRRPGRKGAAAGVVIKGVKRRASEIEGGLEGAREGEDGKGGRIDGGDGSSLPAAEAHNGSPGEAEPGKPGAQADPSAPSTSNATEAPAKADSRGPAKKAKLGLVVYGSSDDEDDG